MRYDKRDLNILALTIYGEARSETREGKVAVAWSVRNRAEADLWKDDKRDWWGEGIANVCLQNWQYSCWKDEPIGQGNRLRAFLVDGDTQRAELRSDPPSEGNLLACWHAAKEVLEDRAPDPTKGSTHYFADYIATPKWARGKKPAAVFGVHKFYNDVEPGYTPPHGRPPPPPDIEPVAPPDEPTAPVERSGFFAWIRRIFG